MMVIGLVIVVVGTSSDAAPLPPVHHVPPATAPADTALELIADAPATIAKLTAHVRVLGERTFATIELVRRTDATWVAVVPATVVTAAGLEYYLAAGDDPVFASAQLPHEVRVELSATAQRAGRDLARAQRRRYRMHSAGEYVSYGTRTIDGTRLADHYYRFDADFGYRLLAYPLEEIRFGVTRLIGETAAEMCSGAPPCTEAAGFRAGGWIELGLGLVEGVRFDGRIMVAANQQSVALGGRGELRAGILDGSHVAAGVEHMAEVGTSGYFRLGWGTVPRLPMAATVEVTNLPASTRPLGVRLYYDLARQLTGAVRVGARVGYAARSHAAAGFTGGANLTIDF